MSDIKILLAEPREDALRHQRDDALAMAKALAWQLACKCVYALASNPEGCVRATVRIHDGTADGRRVSAFGATTNEAAQALRDRLLDDFHPLNPRRSAHESAHGGTQRES